jgi:Zn-finger nucleic acid-binding protein
MQCPLCLDAPLEPKYVDGTEVDVCTRCRGIWLDRGELDRLLDGAPTRRDDRRDDPRRDEPRRDEPRRDDRRDDGRDDRKKKPKSKAKRLADLFEEVLDL